MSACPCLCHSALAVGARALHTLLVKGCPLLTDLGLQSLGERPDNDTFAKLETLDISCCAKVGDAGILALLHGSSSLTNLKMANCPRVRRDDFTDSGLYSTPDWHRFHLCNLEVLMVLVMLCRET